MRLPSLIRRPWLIRHAIRHPRIFALGWREAHGDGRTYDDNPWSGRSLAYDSGRDVRLLGGEP